MLFWYSLLSADILDNGCTGGATAVWLSQVGDEYYIQVTGSLGMGPSSYTLQVDSNDAIVVTRADGT
jgi:hypothetical protein